MKKGLNISNKSIIIELARIEVTLFPTNTCQKVLLSSTQDAWGWYWQYSSWSSIKAYFSEDRNLYLSNDNDLNTRISTLLDKLLYGSNFEARKELQACFKAF